MKRDEFDATEVGLLIALLMILAIIGIVAVTG